MLQFGVEASYLESRLFRLKIEISLLFLNNTCTTEKLNTQWQSADKMYSLLDFMFCFANMNHRGLMGT